jgi:hypothetical protein
VGGGRGVAGGWQWGGRGWQGGGRGRSTFIVGPEAKSATALRDLGYLELLGIAWIRYLEVGAACGGSLRELVWSLVRPGYSIQ